MKSFEKALYTRVELGILKYNANLFLELVTFLQGSQMSFTTKVNLKRVLHLQNVIVGQKRAIQKSAAHIFAPQKKSGTLTSLLFTKTSDTTRLLTI